VVENCVVKLPAKDFIGDGKTDAEALMLLIRAAAARLPWSFGETRDISVANSDGHEVFHFDFEAMQPTVVGVCATGR